MKKKINVLSFWIVNQDVPLISLANIFQNARLWEDALTVARMAVEIAPHFVVNHFTLANVYIAMVNGYNQMFCYYLIITCFLVVTQPIAQLLKFNQCCNRRSRHLSSSDVSWWWHGCCVSWRQEEFEKAMRWYESTLKLQPEFAPAKDRLRTIQCYLLTKRERRQP